MKKLSPKTHLSIFFIITALTGIFIIGMSLWMSCTKYQGYWKNGVTTQANIFEKSKELDPNGSEKYPYNYYIHVSFRSQTQQVNDIKTKIKLPGATWHDIPTGTEIEIIYESWNPSKAELKERVFQEMIFMILFGIGWIVLGGFGLYYRGAIAKKLEFMLPKKLSTKNSPKA